MADKSPKKAVAKKKLSTPKKSVSAPSKPYRSNKPVLGLGTIIALLLFAAIIFFAVYLNRKKESDIAAATPTSGGTFIFTAADGTPSSIKIEPAAGDAVELKRDDKNVWGMILPVKTEADQGMVEAAATQLAAISIVNPKIQGNTADFGLDNPSYVITVVFADGKPRVLKIGDKAISNNGYYARLDNGEIMLVSLSGIDALTQLAVSPPYLNTPTPTALPATETPIPVSDTPIPPSEVTVTPTP